MVALTLRRDLSRPLTHSEMDTNFENLNNRVEISLTNANNLSDVSNIATARTNLGILAATQAVAGLVRGATQSEANAEILTNVFISPATLGQILTNFSAGAVGGGDDNIFWENDQRVTRTYSITAGQNAMSAGAITVGQAPSTITSITSNGTAITISTANHNLVVGDPFAITGTVNYNGSYTVASVPDNNNLTATSNLNVATENTGTVTNNPIITVPNNSEWTVV